MVAINDTHIKLYKAGSTRQQRGGLRTFEDLLAQDVNAATNFQVAHLLCNALLAWSHQHRLPPTAESGLELRV
jgi:hypothetical protein